MESIATISNYLSDNDPQEVLSTIGYLCTATKHTPLPYLNDGEEPIINEAYDSDMMGSIVDLLEWMNEHRESIGVLGLLYQSHSDIPSNPRQYRQYHAIKERFLSFFAEFIPSEYQQVLFSLFADALMTASFQNECKGDQRRMIAQIGDLITFITEMVTDILINESLPYEYRETQSPAYSKN